MSDQRSANSVDRHFGNRLRQRRLEIGMSQETLAEHLGITFQQVQKYEKGVNRIAASRLFDIASALQCDASFFFDGLSKPRGTKPNKRLDEAMASRDGVRLMALYSSIESDRVRRRVIELVEALVEGAKKS